MPAFAVAAAVYNSAADSQMHVETTPPSDKVRSALLDPVVAMPASVEGSEATCVGGNKRKSASSVVGTSVSQRSRVSKVGSGSGKQSDDGKKIDMPKRPRVAKTGVCACALCGRSPQEEQTCVCACLYTIVWSRRALGEHFHSVSSGMGLCRIRRSSDSNLINDIWRPGVRGVGASLCARNIVEQTKDSRRSASGH